MRLAVPTAALLLILAATTTKAETIAGRASVIDADTIQIIGERIRILDIDAPEKDQFCMQAEGDVTWECGMQAAFALIDRIGETDVICETTKLDRYKRHLARCSVDGADLAIWLAESGWGFRLETVSVRQCARHQLVRSWHSGHLGWTVCVAVGVAEGTLAFATNPSPSRAS